MAKIATISIFTLVALLLVLMPASALAQGPTVCGFYGGVTLDGKSVPDGTVVSAWIDNAQKAQTTTTTYQGASVYNLNVPGDDTLKGKDVVFKVGTVTAAQKGSYASWANTKLDLTAVTPTPPPPPPPTMDFSGTVLDDKGANVADGTKVAAYIGTTKVVEATVSKDASGKTVYALKVTGKAGDTVTFKIGDKDATQTATWAAGATTLNLTIKALPPTGDETIPLMVLMLALGGAFLTLVGVLGYRRVRA